MAEHLLDLSAASRLPERVGALLPRLIARQPDVTKEAIIQIGESTSLPALLRPEPDLAYGGDPEAHQAAVMP